MIHRRAHLARLPVPDQFHLALVLEQQEPVPVRQRLPLLNERDQVALLRVGQFVSFSVVRTGHGRGGGMKRVAVNWPGKKRPNRVDSLKIEHQWVV